MSNQDKPSAVGASGQQQAPARVPVVTPDGRYLIVRGRLWRHANPHLAESDRSALVHRLMDGRRAVRAALKADDANALAAARGIVHAAKVSLGERGPVWWTDGAPDLNRHMVHTTPYADWYASRAGTD